MHKLDGEFYKIIQNTDLGKQETAKLRNANKKNMLKKL